MDLSAIGETDEIDDKHVYVRPSVIVRNPNAIARTEPVATFSSVDHGINESFAHITSPTVETAHFKLISTKSLSIETNSAVLINRSDTTTANPNAIAAEQTKACKLKGEISEKTKKRNIKKVAEIKCLRCREKFDSNAAMAYHQTQIHMRESRPQYKCHLCNKSLKCLRSIRHHIASTHIGLRPFKCSKCLRAFASKSYLQTHTKTQHGPSVEFQCTLCPKKYSHKNTLSAHVMNKHGNFFYCYLCKSFLSDKRGLQYHMNLLHTCQSLLTCPFPHCSSIFADESSQKQHINVIHTKQIPFKCIRCPERFYCKIELTTHLANKHGNGDLITHLQISSAKELLAVSVCADNQSQENIRSTYT